MATRRFGAVEHPPVSSPRLPSRRSPAAAAEPSHTRRCPHSRRTRRLRHGPPCQAAEGRTRGQRRQLLDRRSIQRFPRPPPGSPGWLTSSLSATPPSHVCLCPRCPPAPAAVTRMDLSTGSNTVTIAGPETAASAPRSRALGNCRDGSLRYGGASSIRIGPPRPFAIWSNLGRWLGERLSRLHGPSGAAPCRAALGTTGLRS